MALQRSLDLGAAFALATTGPQFVNVDVSGWDYAVLDVVTPSAQINFNDTNDPGSVAGVTDGNALTSTNYQPVAMINTATLLPQVNTTTTGLFKLNIAGRFLQFTAASGTTVGRLVLSLTKIS